MKDILLNFLREHAWYLALGLIALVTSKRSQIDAWAEKHPRLAGVMKLLRSAGLDPWLGVQGLSLIVRGKLPDPPRSKPPGGGAAVGLAFVACFGLQGCSPKFPDQAIADAHSAVADAKAAVAEAEGKAVEAAKAAQAAKAKAIKTARDTIAMVTLARELALATGKVPAETERWTGMSLQLASETLGKVERGEPVSKEELLKAVDAVASVVSELRKLKQAVEPLVDSSLSLVRAAVEAGG